MLILWFTAEPNDYDVYFSLDTIEGTVNKTKPMNASEQNKYVLFVEVSSIARVFICLCVLLVTFYNVGLWILFRKIQDISI